MSVRWFFQLLLPVVFYCPSVRPSVCLFVRPVCLLPKLWTHYVENEWTDFDTHWYKWARALNGQLWGSGGQRSRSNKAEDLEAWRRHHSRPWFLVYSLYVWYLQFVYARIMLFCSFHMYLWCFNKITDIMTILFVFVDIFVSPCAILFFTCLVPRIIRQPFDLLQIFLRFQC